MDGVGGASSTLLKRTRSAVGGANAGFWRCGSLAGMEQWSRVRSAVAGHVTGEEAGKLRLLGDQHVHTAGGRYSAGLYDVLLEQECPPIACAALEKDIERTFPGLNKLPVSGLSEGASRATLPAHAQ